MEMSLEGWNIAKGAAADWVPWGSGNKARARVLGSADGFFFAVVEASPGYRGDPHVHDHPEFLYVLDGAVRTQGQMLERGWLRGGGRIEARRLRVGHGCHLLVHLQGLTMGMTKVLQEHGGSEWAKPGCT